VPKVEIVIPIIGSLVHLRILHPMVNDRAARKLEARLFTTARFTEFLTSFTDNQMNKH
jgi:hypothetical protein